MTASVTPGVRKKSPAVVESSPSPSVSSTKPVCVPDVEISTCRGEMQCANGLANVPTLNGAGKACDAIDDDGLPLSQVARNIEDVPSLEPVRPVDKGTIDVPPLEAVTSSGEPLGDVPPLEATSAGETPIDDVPPLEEATSAGETPTDDVPPLEPATVTVASDDCIPPLEKVPGLNHRAQSGSQKREKKCDEKIEIPEDCANPAAEELFQKMEAQRNRQKEEARKKQAEAAAKVNKSSFGLKKGFFGNSAADTPSTDSKPSKAKKDKVIEVAPKKPSEQPFQLKEVQQAMEDINRDTSWVTPDLMKALQMKPTILKGMSNPRIQKALEMMQKDPEAAKIAYRDDPEVLQFFKEFSALMATHFDIIGKSQTETSTGFQSAASPAVKTSSAPSIITPVSEDAMPPGVDAELVKIMQDPEIQYLIQILRTQPVDIKVFLAQRPHLVPKVKALIDKKLLNVSTI